MTNRRSYQGWKSVPASLALVAALAGTTQFSVSARTTSPTANSNVTVNIGVQQSIGALWLAREKGWMEQAFAKVGAKVNWIEFQSGPPYFQSIASNRLDFGSVGNTPVLVGQAAGVNFEEIAATGISKVGDAILVPKGSSIHNLKDLKGKKIAVAQGSSAYNTLYLALAAAGLTASDVKIVQLQPNEAEPAFQSHAIDAWAIWEPFISLETLEQGATILTDDAKLNNHSTGYNIVRTQFATQHPDLVVLYLEVLRSAIAWENAHPTTTAGIFAKARHLPLNVVKNVLRNGSEAAEPITPAITNQQQKTANFLVRTGGLSHSVDVSKVVNNTFIDKAEKEPNLNLR